MDIQTLRLLTEVAHLGSFAAVARSGGIDPSSVSRTIRAAEQALGVRLFQRTTRRLTATEAGAAFVRRIDALVTEFDTAVDEVRGLGSRLAGTVRLSASVAYGQTRIVPALPIFTEAFPEVSIDLILTDDRIDLVGERIDLAIRLGPEVSGDLICSRLHPTRYRVCASPQYLASAPPLARPEDLAGHQVISYSLSAFRSAWLFRRGAGDIHEVPVNGRIVISSAAALRDAARAGLGPALLADWLVEDDLRAGTLVDVFPEVLATATTFDTAAWIIYPNRDFLPAAVSATIGFLRHHVAGGAAPPDRTIT